MPLSVRSDRDISEEQIKKQEQINEQTKMLRNIGIWSLWKS